MVIIVNFTVALTIVTELRNTPLHKKAAVPQKLHVQEIHHLVITIIKIWPLNLEFMVRIYK